MVQNTSNRAQVNLADRFGFAAPSTAALGALAAWVAVVIYAASNSIVTLLVGIGEANPVADDRNAITYTNLYLLGSLVSLAPMALLYRRDLKLENIRRLTTRQWRLLVISAILSSVLTPGLFFYALEHTTVTNIVLVGRIEPPLFLLATWFFLREKLNPWAMLAGLTALAGAVVIIGTGNRSGMFTLGKGEIATVAATLSFIASTITTRAGLRDVPLGIFAIFRTVIGTSLYFGLVALAFGPGQIKDIFEPIVWNWVWIYALIVILIGQMTWNFAMKHARADDVSLATSSSPLAAILIAMILLGEDPGPGLIPGAILIMLAIAIGNHRLLFGIRKPLAHSKSGYRRVPFRPQINLCATYPSFCSSLHRENNRSKSHPSPFGRSELSKYVRQRAISEQNPIENKTKPGRPQINWKRCLAIACIGILPTRTRWPEFGVQRN